ncbi:MAG: hypothetical protein ACXABY_16060 [Candidatus Thorarchaeota archaeon]
MAVLFITISGLFFVPLSTNMYAAVPALIAPRFGTTVSGEIYQWNASIGPEGDWSPAVNVSVRIFATDQLIRENATTNSRGRFYAQNTYDSGQVLTLTIQGQRFRAFIPYFARGSVFLGEFYLDSEL